MPQTIETRRITSGIRKSIRKGKNKEGQGRKNCHRTEAAAPKIIASSLFALKPKAMVGIEVLEKQSPIFHTSSCGEDDYYRMYNDLLDAVKYAIYEIKGEITMFDPLKNGMSFATPFTYVLKAFENNVLPEGYGYNIDKDKDGYHFTIYSTCKFEEHWHAFEIKPMVEHLEEKGNQDLLTLFFTVVKTLTEEIDMWTWYNGGMGYAECMADDYELDNRYDMDDEHEYMEHANNSELLLSYKSGYIHSIADRIRQSGIEGAQSLMGQLDDFDQSDEVVAWMYKVLEFIMETPGNIRDYVYFQDEEDIEMGLTFKQMITLIWDWDDIYTQYEMESMDAEAQNVGVGDATYHFTVRKCFDLDNYNKREEMKEWPMHLHKLWDYHTDVIESLKNKNDECKDKHVDEGFQADTSNNDV